MSTHVWEEWVERKEVLIFLREGKERLKWAWEVDRKGNYRFPINTDKACSEIQENVSKKHRRKRRIMRLPKPKLAESLAELLLPEKTVKSVWELDHNTGLQNAIKEAAGASYPDVDQCFKTFQAILRAIETAYLVNTWGLGILAQAKNQYSS